MNVEGQGNSYGSFTTTLRFASVYVVPSSLWGCGIESALPRTRIGAVLRDMNLGLSLGGNSDYGLGMWTVFRAVMSWDRDWRRP